MIEKQISYVIKNSNNKYLSVFYFCSNKDKILKVIDYTDDINVAIHKKNLTEVEDLLKECNRNTNKIIKFVKIVYTQEKEV